MQGHSIHRFGDASAGQPRLTVLRLARATTRLILPSQRFLAFVFNSMWVRAECCVDPLRPPPLSYKSNEASAGHPCRKILSEADFSFRIGRRSQQRRGCCGRKKRGSIKGAIRIPLRSLPFLFNHVVVSPSLGFRTSMVL